MKRNKIIIGLVIVGLAGLFYIGLMLDKKNSDNNIINTELPTEEEPKEEYTPIDESTLEQKIYVLINNYRLQNNLPDLPSDSRLSNIARAHSKDMAKNNYFGHVDKEGKGPAARVGSFYCLLYIGENIWQGQAYKRIINGKVHYYTEHELATLIVKSWLNDERDRENLRIEHGRMGIGATITDDHKVYVTYLICRG